MLYTILLCFTEAETDKACDSRHIVQKQTFLPLCGGSFSCLVQFSKHVQKLYTEILATPNRPTEMYYFRLILCRVSLYDNCHNFNISFIQVVRKTDY